LNLLQKFQLGARQTQRFPDGITPRERAQRRRRRVPARARRAVFATRRVHRERGSPRGRSIERARRIGRRTHEESRRYPVSTTVLMRRELVETRARLGRRRRRPLRALRRFRASSSRRRRGDASLPATDRVRDVIHERVDLFDRSSSPRPLSSRASALRRRRPLARRRRPRRPRAASASLFLPLTRLHLLHQRLEPILRPVIRSPTHHLRDRRPFIPQFFVRSEQRLVLGRRPLVFLERRRQVSRVPSSTLLRRLLSHFLR